MKDEKCTIEKQHRLVILLSVLLLIIFIAAIGWFLAGYRNNSSGTVQEISSFYLKVLNTQTAVHIDSMMESSLARVKMVGEEIRTSSGDMDFLQGKMEELAGINGFNFLGFIDSKGNLYTSDGIRSGISKIPNLKEMIECSEPGFVFNQKLADEDLVLLYAPVTPMIYQGNEIRTVIAGVDSENMAHRLSLEKQDAYTYSSIVSSDGDYIAHTYHGDLDNHINMFSFLDRAENKLEDMTVDEFRSSFKDGESGLTLVNLDSRRFYLYYAPIPDTDWMLITMLLYDQVGVIIDRMGRGMTVRTMLLLAVCILCVVSIASIMIMLVRRSEKKALAVSEAKSAFLSNMSHDIRTPMNAIIGFTTLAVKNIDQKEQVKDYLNKILSSGNYLLSLINDILDMSRIESGKMQLEEMECNLSEVLHGIKNIIQGQINGKQISLYMDTQNVVDENVYCDQLRLNQVLMNLLSNAVKFTPAGGKISVSIRQKDTAPEGYGSYEIRVKDTGVGMSPEFARNVFVPFEREKSSTISRTQGTGLGMAITKNIVDMMGGTITVNTQQGKGTEFIVSVNFRLQTVKNQVEEIKVLSGLRALVVDDDFNTCDSVAKMLNQIGMRSEWTVRGREAVLRTRQSVEMKDEFHVYIIDLQLPDINGIEVTRQIRKLVGRDVPIMIMTAYDWSGLEVEAEAAGVTGFCSKPMFLSDLREALLKALECDAAGGDAGPEAGEMFRGKRVLLVEDNELNREIAYEILKEYGFVVEQAEDGAVAVAMVKESTPGYYDLVLMDVQMPVMDGYEATRTIRKLEEPGLASVPIVAMTANAFAEDKEDAMNAGMNGHISKPIDINRLVSVIQRIL